MIASEPIIVEELFMSEKHELTLYYFNECPYCQKVLSYLQEAKKTVPMKNTKENNDFREELKEQGGKTQVPCLMIDGKALYESDDIISWLQANLD